MSRYDDTDDADFEPNGNRLDDATVRFADRRRPERSKDRYDQSFTASALATQNDCTEALHELSAIIEQISNAIERLKIKVGDEPNVHQAEWLHKAGAALFHKRRIHAEIAARYGKLCRPVQVKTIPQNELEAIVSVRKEAEHIRKMERIAAANSRNSKIGVAFRRLVAEKLGQDVMLELIAKADAMVDAE
jgi:hypothetical protein